MMDAFLIDKLLNVNHYQSMVNNRYRFDLSQDMLNNYELIVLINKP